MYMQLSFLHSLSYSYNNIREPGSSHRLEEQLHLGLPVQLIAQTKNNLNLPREN